MGIKKSLLIWHAYRANKGTQYRTFSIPKKKGGTRPIEAPHPSLKKIQRRLLEILTEVYEPRTCVTGFVRDGSIRKNAERHVGKRWVLNVDLEDFFPTIHFGRVRGMFMHEPFNLPDGVATLLAQICCYDQRLPQGAPTSPIISNMLCSKLDTELTRLARRNKAAYTRYADDLTFSTRSIEFPSALADVTHPDRGGDTHVGHELRRLITKNGFKINGSKFRLQRFNKRQQVTGLTVNKKLNVNRNFLREVRAMFYAWETFGLKAAQDHFEKYYHRPAYPLPKNVPKPKFEKVLEGKLAFIKMVRGESDALFLHYRNRYNANLGR